MSLVTPKMVDEKSCEGVKWSMERIPTVIKKKHFNNTRRENTMAFRRLRGQGASVVQEKKSSPKLLLNVPLYITARVTPAPTPRPRPGKSCGILMTLRLLLVYACSEGTAVCSSGGSQDDLSYLLVDLSGGKR